MKVEWTRLAEDRVFEIAAYIAQDSFTEAEKWLDRLFDYVSRIEIFPESGRTLQETPNRKDVRELLFGNYRIIYRLEKKVAYILTVRNFKQMLPIEEIK